MAAATVGAARAVVHVVGAVAGHTLAGRVLVNLSGVARTARGIGMAAVEAKPGCIEMIEVDASKGLLAVARVTVVAEMAVVHVVVCVTGMAFANSLAVPRSGLVAAGARRIGVCAEQRKIRCRMVEQIRQQSDHVGVPPFVLGVTGSAFVAGRVRIAAVETGCRADVRRNFLVTVEAQRSLRVAAERGMTGAALGFDLGMRLHHRPGHHQRLDRSASCACT